MAYCEGGFPTNEMFENQNAYFYTQSYTSSPMEWTRTVRPSANLLTGYYSDQSARNLTPGAEPGKWIAPNIWETHDQGKGIKKPLTVLHLFAGACSTSSANPAEKFCNSIVDASGTHKLPKICGGTAPNFSDYNPTAEALGEIAPEIQALANAASNQAEEIIKANRTKIFMVVGVIFLLILIIYMWAS